MFIYFIIYLESKVPKIPTIIITTIIVVKYSLHNLHHVIYCNFCSFFFSQNLKKILTAKNKMLGSARWRKTPMLHIYSRRAQGFSLNLHICPYLCMRAANALLLLANAISTKLSNAGPRFSYVIQIKYTEQKLKRYTTIVYIL